LTLIGIELPRFPIRGADGEMLAPGAWRVGRVSLLHRCIQTALAFTDAESIRLLTGEPDQAVFDAVESFGPVDAVLSDWLGGLASRAPKAQPEDLVVIMRMAVVTRGFASLGQAIEGCRALADVESVLPVVQDRGEAVPCAAFEVHKLSRFGIGYAPTGKVEHVTLDGAVEIRSSRDVAAAAALL
jgi:hypothetical protein